jgi:hypothetical protein
VAAVPVGWTRLDIPLAQPDPTVVRNSLSVTSTPTAWVDGVQYITGVGDVYTLSVNRPTGQRKARIDNAFDTLIANGTHPFKAFVLCYTDDPRAITWRADNGL